ncbi:Protein TIC 21, chloroplastic [Galdieria sulphuraria]|nr:Protein TIC 21, chloroplastic [Galdieria sulphuraria]
MNPTSPPLSSSTFSDTRYLAFLLWKNSWISWWAQLVLSVIAGVILLFAMSVTPIRSSTTLVRSSLIGLLSACIALTFCFLSVLWTWGYTRWSVKLQQGEETTTAMNKLASSIQSGILLTVVGMFFTVIAAQAIVGRLLAKILSAGLQPSPLVVNNQTAIQPLDIFIVQANTNILLSQWISLTFGLWMAHKLKAHRDKK